MAELNAVITTVSIAGNPVHFIRMYLFQKFNAHHRVELEVDYEEFGGKWMEKPVELINYIGKEINITMQHKQGGENLFSGIISNVAFTGYHGRQNTILITGTSPTIKLAGKPTMDSFMDLPLQQVVQELVPRNSTGTSICITTARILTRTIRRMFPACGDT